jgi:hypothetical protein
MAKFDIQLDDFDFGFSAVSEDELAIREQEAEARVMAEAEKLMQAQQAEATSAIDEVTATAQEYKDRLNALNKMVQPLLKNLAADADNKPYIYWPDRKKKMQDFMARVNAVVSG